MGGGQLVGGDVVHEHQQHGLRASVVEERHPDRDLAFEVECVPRLGRHRRVQAGRRDGAGGERHLGCGERALHADAVVVLEHGAQDLVPVEDRAHRVAQRRRIGDTAQAQRQRHVVGRARPLEAELEPQPLLPRRQRRPVAALDRSQRDPQGRSTVRALRGERLDGRVVEDGADRQFHAERVADRRDQPGRREGVTAEEEEVVVDADRVEAEDVRERGAQHAFVFGGGGAPGDEGREVRFRQRRAVHLAVRGERQRVEEHERRRHHVRRQPPRHVLAGRRRVAVAADQVGDEPRGAGRVGTRPRRRPA